MQWIFLGNVVEEAGLGQEMGEPDRTCVPVLGSLTPSAADPEFIGQMLLTMVDEDGAPFDVERGTFLTACGSSYASADCSRL
ncbi:gamma-Glu-putrescine synthase [Escherichia coli]|uniref:Gamma-Glu-putrescine synthase n=1 Tax=Escherichia coli TaxID=562 RepID=A0A2X3LWX7_ECOLX|nr:gamma-Glu-putrescine synthase [Escherichia coli]